jgi:hypothetical protein
MNSVSLILFFSLSLSFCWVNYGYPLLKDWIWRKPFGCAMCMTGWFALVMSFGVDMGWGSLLMLPAGVFVGAMFEGVKMRWL